MNKEQIREFIVNYIEKKGKLPKNINFDEFDYITNGYIDSMGLIKFVVALEEKFNIELSEEDIMAQKFRTINGLVNTIYEKDLS